MSDTLMPEGPVVDESSGSSSRRNLVVLLVAVVALAVVAGAAYFLFLSGSSEEDLGPVPSAAGQAADEADQAKAQAKKDKAEAEAEQAAFNDKDIITVGRDPFEPLSVEAKKPQPVDDSTNQTDPATNSGGGAPAPAPTPTPTPTPDNDSYTVTLISGNANKGEATIDVDGKRYVVAEKDLFPSSTIGPFKLISVNEKKSGKVTATIAFGSASTVDLAVDDPIEFTA
jgi:hypothetical protein